MSPAHCVVCWPALKVFEENKLRNRTSSSQHAENSATAVISHVQQSQQAMSLFTGAVIHGGQFSISKNSLNQSPKLAVQEAKVESSLKRYKRSKVLHHDSD